MGRDGSCRGAWPAANTVGDVGASLTAILERAGFGGAQQPMYTWYSAPDGFFLATRVEQFESDGSSKVGPVRWSMNYNRPSRWTLQSVIEDLLGERVGHFRVFLFSVSDEPPIFVNRQVTQDQARRWAGEGALELPPDVRRLPLTDAHRCYVHVYEFAKDREDAPAAPLSSPGRYQLHDHLVGARLVWRGMP